MKAAAFRPTLLVLLLACGSPQPPAAQTAKPVADWTFMVFMNAKNNLEEDAIGNFLQMAAVPNSDRVNVLVELARPKKHYTSSYGPWQGTRIFRLTQNMTPKDPPVETLGDTDMGVGRSVAQFVAWSRTNYPARHYALVVWDHGQGWRFQYAKTFKMRQAAAAGRAADLPPAAASVVRSGFKAISHDDETGHVIYNRDLADALHAVLGTEKLSLISFDACLMGMIETAYAMKGVADYMVASEELEPGAGWDYTLVLRGLGKQPAIDGRGLAALIVDAYRESYGELRLTTLSAVSLSQVEAVAAAISELAQAARAALPARRAAIAAARAACGPYGGSFGLTNTIDIGCLLDQVRTASSLAGLHAPALKVQGALKAAVTRNYSSQRIVDEGPGGTGLAIYFPPDAAAHHDDPDHDGYEARNRNYPVAFVEHEQWAPFLWAYLGLPGQSPRPAGGT